MINLKNSGSEFDFESYTKKLLENIKKDLRPNDLNFLSSNTKTTKCAIMIDDIN
ncbi:Transposase for IS660 (plasmid) [Bacillus anthracis str. SVA11]|nr:Transposase for IS660 [Bacillus anthracis str. SVA11]